MPLVTNRYIWVVLCCLCSVGVSSIAYAHKPQTHDVTSLLAWHYLEHRATSTDDTQSKDAFDLLSKMQGNVVANADDSARLVLGLHPSFDLLQAQAPARLSTSWSLTDGTQSPELVRGGPASLLSYLSALPEHRTGVWATQNAPYQRVITARMATPTNPTNRTALQALALAMYEQVVGRVEDGVCEQGVLCQSWQALFAMAPQVRVAFAAPFAATWLVGNLLTYATNKHLASPFQSKRQDDDLLRCGQDDVAYQTNQITQAECQSIQSQLHDVARWSTPGFVMDEGAFVRTRVAQTAYACRVADQQTESFDYRQCDVAVHLGSVTSWLLSVQDVQSTESFHTVMTGFALWQKDAAWMASNASIDSLLALKDKSLGYRLDQPDRVLAFDGIAKVPDGLLGQASQKGEQLWAQSLERGLSLMPHATTALLQRRFCASAHGIITTDNLGEDCALTSAVDIEGATLAQLQWPSLDGMAAHGMALWYKPTIAASFNRVQSNGVHTNAPDWRLGLEQLKCKADDESLAQSCTSSIVGCARTEQCGLVASTLNETEHEIALQAMRLKGLGMALNAVQEATVPHNLAVTQSWGKQAYERWVAHYIAPSNQHPIALLDGPELNATQSASLCACDDAASACQNAPCKGKSGLRPATSLAKPQSLWSMSQTPGSLAQSWGTIKNAVLTSDEACQDGQPWSGKCFISKVDEAYEQLQNDMNELAQASNGCERFAARRLSWVVGFRTLRIVLEESAQDELVKGLSEEERRVLGFWLNSTLASAHQLNKVDELIELNTPELKTALVGTHLWQRVAQRTLPLAVAASAIVMREAASPVNGACDAQQTGQFEPSEQEPDPNMGAMCVNQTHNLLKGCFGLRKLGAEVDRCKDFVAIDAYDQCNGVVDAKRREDCSIVASALASCACARMGDTQDLYSPTAQIGFKVGERDDIQGCVAKQVAQGQIARLYQAGHIDAVTSMALRQPDAFADDDKDGVPNLVDHCPEEPHTGKSSWWQGGALRADICLGQDTAKGLCKYGCALEIGPLIAERQKEDAQ